MLKSRQCSPDDFVQNFSGPIARSCEYLSAVCTEVGQNMGSKARAVLKSAILECLSDILYLMEIYISKGYKSTNTVVSNYVCKGASNYASIFVARFSYPIVLL